MCCEAKVSDRSMSTFISQTIPIPANFVPPASKSFASKPPPLMHKASVDCVSCNKRAAGMYCGRCGVTPYCSMMCQRTDWNRRHRSVCHNLASLSLCGGDDVDNGAMPSLRAPHSLPSTAVKNEPAPNRDNGFGRKNDSFKRKNDGYGRKEESYGRKEEIFGGKEGNERKDFGSRGKTDGYGKQEECNRRGEGADGRDRHGGERRNNYGSDNRGQRTNQGRGGNQQKTDGKPPQNSRPARDEEEEEWPAASTTRETFKPEASTSSPSAPETAAPQFNSSAIAASPQPVRTASAPKDAVKLNKPPLVPEKCVLDVVNIGDTLLVSVLSSEPDVVCLALSAALQDGYTRLCEDYVLHCEQQQKGYTPKPGETFSVKDTDGAWYRARCLDEETAALIDAGRVVRYAELSRTALGAEYAGIVEYCCVMEGATQVGDCLSCLVKSRDALGRLTVSGVDADSQQTPSDVVLARWTPPVKEATLEVNGDPKPATPSVAPSGTPTVVVPSVARPPLADKARVTLVSVESSKKIVLREAHPVAVKRDDMLEEEVLVYGNNAVPLQTAPAKGDYVIAKFTDGLYYRALVKRTNVKQNKYLLEYVEYGNEEIAPLERLYPCPADLQLPRRACCATVAALADVQHELTQPALDYLNQLKERADVLVVSVPGGGASLESGDGVLLTVESSGVSVNRRVGEMCKPDWKKVEENGGDVLDLKPVMMDELTYLELPESGALTILDSATLDGGCVAACPPDCVPYMTTLLGSVTDRMSEYCESKIGSEPYMPRIGEVCIAKCPPHENWFRAVMLEQAGGAGGPTANLLYIDYGNLGEVPPALVRKMMREYVTDLPALASTVDIKDFPAGELTPEMMKKARAHLQITEDGSTWGVLKVTSCVKTEPGCYTVTAPELLAAMRQ